MIETVETGIRLQPALARAVVLEADRRGVTMGTVARVAMIEFARKHGVALDGGDRHQTPRRPTEQLLEAQGRKLGIAYPASWRSKLAELLEEHPTILRLSDLWRTAIATSCGLT